MNIVTIGGGTGQYHILRALMELKKHLPDACNITAIPTTSDSGGSSGLLRFDYHVVAPGDISQCVLGLHPKPEEVAWLFGHRFEGGMLNGHTTRNIIVTTALQNFGPSQEALNAISHTFGLDGNVAPATFSETHVHLLLKDGTVLLSENDIYHKDIMAAGGVESIWLEPMVKPNMFAVQAINEADILIVCPGSLYCSIIPILLIKPLAEALCNSNAVKIYVANLMNQRGHISKDWTVFDYMRYIDKYLQKDFFDKVIVNTQKPDQNQIFLYDPEKMYVSAVPKHPDDVRCEVISKDLLMKVPEHEKNNTSDAIAHLRASVRHDHKRLSGALAVAFASYNVYM